MRNIKPRRVEYCCLIKEKHQNFLRWLLMNTLHTRWSHRSNMKGDFTPPPWIEMQAEVMQIASGHSHLRCSPVPLQAAGSVSSRQTHSFQSWENRMKERNTLSDSWRQVNLKLCLAVVKKRSVCRDILFTRSILSSLQDEKPKISIFFLHHCYRCWRCNSLLCILC